MKTTSAVPILKANEDGQFDFDENALFNLLDGCEENIVVVSVAGAFRKGKSFLLDYCLRYLEYGNLGPEDEPLDGFSWRGGSERDTTGMLAWNKLFKVVLPSGEPASILLLDTQGAFDSHSTLRQAATVFALSTLVSSVQVYNLSQNIQEDDLHHLQLFTEYGRLALRTTSSVPFQKLTFLVRDWAYPYDAPYGHLGGQTILDRRLKVFQNQHRELQIIRNHIKSCFTDISCYLMPHPGKRVSADSLFDGRPSDLEPEFKQYLLDFLGRLLSPSSLMPKQIAGQNIKSKDLVFYVKSYLEIFTGDTLPQPKTIVNATAEANNLAAVAYGRDTYYNLMKDVCGSTRPYLNPSKLNTEHGRIKSLVMEEFKKKPKMGGYAFSETYREQLTASIEEQFHQFKSFNESKNIYKALLTPILLMGMAVTFYVLSGVFGLIGIYYLANLCNLIMGTALIGVLTWSYIRYTGDLADVASFIDWVMLNLWENFLKPLYQAAVEDPITRASGPSNHLVGVKNTNDLNRFK